MQELTPELDNRNKVGFTMRRVSEHLYPITTLQAATRQIYAERLVGELALTGEPGAIGFDYHTERRGKEVDVVLTISGTDEVRVREVAQLLEEHYHGEPCYEEEVDILEGWRDGKTLWLRLPRRPRRVRAIPQGPQAGEQDARR